MLRPMNQIMSTFLLECMRNSEDANFDHLCLAILKQFAFDETTVTFLKEGMLHEQWILQLEGKSSPILLNFKERVACVKLLCSSPFVNEIERETMCERVYALVMKGHVFNDLVNRCQWGIPDPDKKSQLWQMITDPFNQDSLQVYYWKEDAFCQFASQFELLEPYLDAFYQCAPLFINF